MKESRKIKRRGERGQVLPIMALLLISLLAIIGLAVDVGRVYVGKAELSRALDSAALAGALELPDTDQAEAKAEEYIDINMPNATFLEPDIDVPAQKVTIRASTNVDMIFLRVLGIDNVEVEAEAQAGASNFGAGALPLDVVLILDDTGTMGSGCTETQRTTPSANQTSPVCPIGLSRNAAKQFLDVLFPASGNPPSTKVAMVPYRGCYHATQNINPITGEHALRGCVKLTDSIVASSDKAAITAKINTVQGYGGFPGTNFCLGLARGWKSISGGNEQPGSRKVAVIISDGDNRYSDHSFHSRSISNVVSGPRQVGNPVPNTYPSSTAVGQTNASPPFDATVNSCWPDPSNQDTTDYGSDYNTRINLLDSRTLAQADAMKAAGVEVFVVGYGVQGGADSGAACDRSLVGTGTNRQSSTDTRDRNLNKCLASSKTGTNDHYFETGALGLPEIFVHIAETISYRLIK